MSKVFALNTPARANAQDNRRAFKLTDGQEYLALRWRWYARSTWDIVRTDNLVLLYEYGDAHGMTGEAFFRISDPEKSWVIDLDVPARHGKYRKIRLSGVRAEWKEDSFARLHDDAEQV